MFTFEYRFYPKSFDQSEIDAFDQKMQCFISCLSKNGQILASCRNTVKFPDHYACRVVAPKQDSLEQTYANKYTRRFLAEVIEESAQPPQLVFIGENYDFEDCCTCEAPSHYILFAQSQSNASPVLCGDCKQSVPLYTLPKTYEDSEYYNLLEWQDVYQSCDMQFLCGIGERHGYKMMNDPYSAVSQKALVLCRFLEEKTAKPFYYFLFRYYSKNKTLCPKCGQLWINHAPHRIHYDFVCEKCRLVSNDPF